MDLKVTTIIETAAYPVTPEAARIDRFLRQHGNLTEQHLELGNHSFEAKHVLKFENPKRLDEPIELLKIIERITR